MDARTKLNKLITTTLGMMTYFLEEITKPSGQEVAMDAGSCSQASGRDTREMLRVVDSQGEEYLCPIGELHDENFVHEPDKRGCLDYNIISEHYLEPDFSSSLADMDATARAGKPF